jgi:hypothetical protein
MDLRPIRSVVDLSLLLAAPLLVFKYIIYLKFIIRFLSFDLRLIGNYTRQFCRNFEVDVCSKDKRLLRMLSLYEMDGTDFR